MTRMTMSMTHRIAQAVAGLALATIGVAGLASHWAVDPAVAQTDTREHMDEMMDQCAGMMDTMGGMSSMMNGRGVSNMMEGMAN